MDNKKNILILLIAVIIFLMIIIFSCVQPEEEKKEKKLPKWASQCKLTAYDAEEDEWFGNSVSVSDDYVIIGSCYDEIAGDNKGSAYIFHRTSVNSWDSGTKITAFDSDEGDYFGWSVAISGDYAAVGVPYEELVTTDTNKGAVYIYHRTDINTWSYNAKLIAPDYESRDNFGYSVSISGDYVITGAINEDGSGTDRGAAYVFHRTGANTWDAGTKITAADAQDSDHFGISVSISGDYAIIGADGEDGSGTDRGAVYIFHRTEVNTWDAGIKKTLSSASDNDFFGYSVAISGDYAIAGAYLEDGTATNTGSAYIFHRTGTNTWDSGIKISALNPAAYDNFGYSVAISGDFAIAGASYADLTGSGFNCGAAYIFTRTGTNTWSSGIKKTAFDAQEDDYFGYSVAISGNFAVIGSYHEDEAGADCGAAYILR